MTYVFSMSIRDRRPHQAANMFGTDREYERFQVPSGPRVVSPKHNRAMEL